ncbi:MAG: SDR family oxidoreductase [Rhizobiales bacterium]|nr:SDR family oxidoreductase [Hyphomicrobiales bacterium]
MKSILITGCSSGIGETCALGLKARGWRVFATARKPADIGRLGAQGLETFYLDYAEPASVDACVAEVAKRADGKLGALFNNGAYGQPGAVEDLSREVLEAQFAANVFGWHQLTRACLPLMRLNGGGRIVQNSSVLGLVAMKWRGAYNASKFAIEALSDTMRLELKGTGIHVILIEPGPIASRFTERALEAFNRNIDAERSHYKEAYANQRARLGRGGSNRFKLPADAVLAKLVKALESPRPKARYFVTTPTYMMAAARRILPLFLLDPLLDKASDQ